MKKYEKNCPKCNKTLIYSTKYSLTESIKKNRFCKNEYLGS